MSPSPRAAPPLRYRHSRSFHAVRIGVGVLVCIVLTTALGMPHGLWTTVSFLVVITGLQHHGNIGRKAMERVVGTLIGAAGGLLVLLQQQWLGQIHLTWLLLALFCGACAYHAIGRGGYMALLAGLTLIIVTGEGVEPLQIGLWRAANVLLGVAVALAMSFVLPLYACWFWREALAKALRRCIEELEAAAAEDPDRPAEVSGLTGIGATLQTLRTLIPSVIRESGTPASHMEEIQRSVRIVFSCTELIAAAPNLHADVTRACRLLDQIAGSLEAGTRETVPPGRDHVPDEAGTDDMSLVGVLERDLHRLSRLLAEAPGLWHG
ncbi:FUSC family protein [Amorphus orientalis]|uniref:FUSC family protein n=1 Tax=Amorphus orientalis TaxID=649198 RepID=A0AAE4ATW0_9HYPH|nr:FUSC family protein [Amorphus orientalis]MDQ0316635.1 hypothetical protein [Amorphus orientalis]